MSQQTLLTVVFLCQILLLSGFLPAQLARRARSVLRTYPPDVYPRLYATSTDAMESTLRVFGILNAVALVTGFLLLAADLRAGGAIFQWNGGSALVGYMLVQWMPLLATVTRKSFPYFSMKRPADAGSSRSAELRPRRLTDFVSPALLGAAMVLYVAFAALVVAMQRFDHPWFGGYWNLAGVTVLYLVFAAVIYLALYGKKRDPYMAGADRHRAIRRTVTIAVCSAILWTLFMGATIVLRHFGLEHSVPTALSLVIQLAVVASHREFRVDENDFEVYRAESVTT